MSTMLLRATLGALAMLHAVAAQPSSPGMSPPQMVSSSAGGSPAPYTFGTQVPALTGRPGPHCVCRMLSLCAASCQWLERRYSNSETEPASSAYNCS